MGLKRAIQRVSVALLAATSMTDGIAQERETPQELFKRYNCSSCLPADVGCEKWSGTFYPRVTYAVASGAKIVAHNSHVIGPMFDDFSNPVYFDVFVQFSDVAFIRNDFDMPPDQVFFMMHEPNRSFATASGDEWQDAIRPDRKYLIVSLDNRDKFSSDKPALTRACELPQ